MLRFLILSLFLLASPILAQETTRLELEADELPQPGIVWFGLYTGTRILKLGARHGTSMKATEEETQKARAATREYQSDDERIVALAKLTLGDATKARQKTARLVTFVADYIDYIEDMYGPEYSNAVDVMLDKRGDCSAHANLFVALARAAGIPAREVAEVSAGSQRSDARAMSARHVGERDGGHPRATRYGPPDPSRIPAEFTGHRAHRIQVDANRVTFGRSGARIQRIRPARGVLLSRVKDAIREDQLHTQPSASCRLRRPGMASAAAPAWPVYALAKTDRPGTRVIHSESASDTQPRLIGPYRIREKIGEGGTAVVYLAEQVYPFRRQVALKVLKSHLTSEDSVARFEQELRTLGHLSHSHIAQVFDFAARGRSSPYFTMEYVPGRPITDFCDEQALSMRARVKLFLDVCAAVQYIHQNGVVHRDIKPSNMLVAEQNGRAVPKLIDFGLARVNNELWEKGMTSTKHGQVLGTVCYMSPEQASLTGAPVDARTDIYSLGVVLFEMMVGVLPFEKPSDKSEYARFLQRVREVEPDRPSERLRRLNDGANMIAGRRGSTSAALERDLRGDLDWIILKAIDRDPQRRYATVADLSRDLEAYLRDSPVSASPPTARYRFAKAARRHRRPLVVSLAVVLAVTASAVLGAWWHLRVDAQHRRDIALLRLSERVQVQVANAHLWLEEALAKDEQVDLARDVYEPIGDTMSLLESAQRGGETPVGLVEPGSSKNLDRDLRALTGKMAEFNAITQRRWTKRHGEGLTGGTLDQRHDEVYGSILQLTGSLAAGAINAPRGASRAFVRTILVVNLSALGFCVVVLVVVARAWAGGRAHG